MSIELMKRALEFITGVYFGEHEGSRADREKLEADLTTAIQQAEAQKPATGEPVAWLDEMLADTREVFDAGGSETPQVVRDVIEYVKSWVTVYSEKNHPAPAAQPTPSEPATTEPVANDGWLQDRGLLYRLTDEKNPQNRDEIKVTMADSSRSDASCTRRAGELLDRIRATHPAPSVPDDVVRDAERYRWLRDNGVLGFSGAPSWRVYVSFDAMDAYAQTLDSNIDAAMLAAK